MKDANELETPIARKVLHRLVTGTENGNIAWSPTEEYAPDRDWLSGKIALAQMPAPSGAGAGMGTDAESGFTLNLLLGGLLREGHEMGPMFEIIPAGERQCWRITDFHEDEQVRELLYDLARAVDAAAEFPEPSHPMDTEEQRTLAVDKTFDLMDLREEEEFDQWGTSEEIETRMQDVSKEWSKLEYQGTPKPLDGRLLMQFMKALNAATG